MKKTLHSALPQSMTVENLAQWITENAHERREHEEQIPLTDDVIRELEHKSSIASRAIDVLKEVEKEFKNFLKNGTLIDVNIPVAADEDPKRGPQVVTIPPTKGMDALNENRQWADKQLRDGYRTETTLIFLIPFPENNSMIAVDSQGVEWPEYNREMSEPEKVTYDKPILKEASKAAKKGKQVNFMEEEEV